MTTKRVMRPEDFDTPAGFADDFDAEIVDAWFASPKTEYQEKVEGGANDPVLNLKLEGPDLDKPIDQFWSIGAKRLWQVTRDGKEIVSGKNADIRNFVSTSRAGELVNRILALAGGGDRAKGVEIIQARGYYMTEAEFYIGINAHWEQVEMTTVSGEKRDVLMPTALISFGDGTSSATGSEPGGAEFTDEEIGKLAELASGKTEQQLKQGIMRSELKGNKALLNAVFNKELLAQLEAAEKLTKGPDGAYI